MRYGDYNILMFKCKLGEELIGYTIDELLTLQAMVKEELDLKLAIRSKEGAIELANQVGESTGTPQDTSILEDELRLLRKKYAQHISNFDQYKDMPGYVMRDSEGNIMQASDFYNHQSDKRLEPIDEPLPY